MFTASRASVSTALVRPWLRDCVSEVKTDSSQGCLVPLARQLAGYLSIALITCFTGGVAIGSIAPARRTLSSYPAFLASANPSDISVISMAACHRSAGRR
jgi:hypothetical protein